jgi:hypothetical protein
MFGGGGMVTFAIDTLVREGDDFIGVGVDGHLVVRFSKDTPYMLVKRELFEQFSEIDEYRRHVDDQLELLAVRAEIEPTLLQKQKELSKLDEEANRPEGIPVELGHPGRYA